MQPPNLGRRENLLLSDVQGFKFLELSILLNELRPYGKTRRRDKVRKNLYAALFCNFSKKMDLLFLLTGGVKSHKE